MDKNELEGILEFSSSMKSIHLRRKNLKSQYENDTMMYYNGGTFVLDQAFLGYLFAVSQRANGWGEVIVDTKQTPISINDFSDFYHSAWKQHEEANRKYYQEYTKLHSTTDLKKALDLE